MSLVEIKVPDIGDFKEVEVIELLVKVGDTVAVDQSLITVESDKASMEIPSSHAGVVSAIKVKLGDKVKQGSVIASLDAVIASEAKQPQTASASGLAMTGQCPLTTTRSISLSSPNTIMANSCSCSDSAAAVRLANKGVA